MNEKSRFEVGREAYRFARNTLPQLLQMVSSPSVESAGYEPAFDGGEEAATPAWTGWPL